MTTKPDRSRCSTIRLATIRAMISAASRFRLRPSKRNANARASAGIVRLMIWDGLWFGVGSGHEEPFPIFQQFARDNSPGGNDVREVPAVAARRRGPAVRARDRHQPRDSPVLVEPVWPDVRCRDPEEAGSASARLSSVALAFG